MLPENAYPSPLPLSRAAALDLLGRLDDHGSLAGVFLTFVQIPVEERIGDWRFAGATGTLADAVRRAQEFADEMGLRDPDRPGGVLRLLLENTSDTGYDSEFMFPRKSPVTVTGPHRLVLCVQDGAPYEGLGASVVEVESLVGSSFDGRAPQTELPEQWQDLPEE